MMQATHFLLVPDVSAARRIRRRIANAKPRSGVVVGTWNELLEHARRAYLVPQNSAWEDGFRKTLDSIQGAFWAESYKVAPEETSAALIQEFNRVFMDVESVSLLVKKEAELLADRPRKHLEDLIRLYNALDGAFPEQYSVCLSLLATDANDAIRDLVVYWPDTHSRLALLQRKLVEKLNADSGLEPDSYLRELLAEEAIPQSTQSTSLASIQSKLYSSSKESELLDVDETVQWVGVRDYLEEAEVAAGMVQQLLDADKNLLPKEIGVMIPDSYEYAVAVDDAFGLGGMMLSGLPVDRWQRDLGGEAVFHFIQTKQKPTPVMALAVCLTSPLMPWTRSEGAQLAQSLMDGDYSLSVADASPETERILQLLQQEDETPNALAVAIEEYVSLLDEDEAFEVHLRRARELSSLLKAYLDDVESLDWVHLKRLASPSNLSTGESPDFNLDGVTVWRETQEPWRPVKHLLVLGFSEGHYPASARVSSVFSNDDLESINRHLELSIPTASEELRSKRLLFKNQIGAVSESITFMIPGRSAAGENLSSSDSFVFMKALFNKPDELIKQLGTAESLESVRNLATAALEEADSKWEPDIQDVELDRDILALRVDREGNQKPESPSSLETLMVSPLAWLLRRIQAEPLGWSPESLDVKLLGTLAHQAFEDLFPKGKPVLGEQDIIEQAPLVIDAAIEKLAPFLKSMQWHVEKRNFVNGTIRAAVEWNKMLQGIDAEILGSEEWLVGDLDGVPIHGQADAILSLSEERLLVIDYKRQSSTKRQPVMKKGYDSQASLYRTMIETGGLKSESKKDVADKLSSASQIGVVYFLMNDQKALSDTQLAETKRIPGWQSLENDVAEFAIDKIKERLEQIRSGHVSLNRSSDKGFFESEAKLTPYALETSPLIELFTIVDEQDLGEL